MSDTDPNNRLPPYEAVQKLRLLLAQVEAQIPHSDIPQATPPRERKKLTIGMATYDDYDGLYFTIQALRLYQPEVQDQIELLVIDNHPEGPVAPALKALENWIPNYRYIPYRARRGTAVRDVVFYESNADYVMCIDAHVLLAPGAIRQLIAYFDAHPDTRDLLQGPLLDDGLKGLSTHFEPQWRGAMYGVWAADERGADPAGAPFEIPMQGLGVFACHRAAWPGFNPHMRGFGGEEGYLHEKFRRAGGRVLCLPFLRWLHRFNRPTGVPYTLAYEDRLRNYRLTLRELGQDEALFEAHFREVLGEEAGQRLLDKTRAEIENPFCAFDAIYCINLDERADRWEQMTRRFNQLGIGWLVRRFSAIKTPDNHHVGCALSHRAIIDEARRHSLKNVLVLEDDAIFHRDTLHFLRFAVEELRTQAWDLCYLGGYRHGKRYKLAAGCEYLEGQADLTCTHAIAYNQTVYDHILADVPDARAEGAKWVAQHLALDQYLSHLRCAKFVTRPSLATQQPLIPAEDPTYQDRFII